MIDAYMHPRTVMIGANTDLPSVRSQAITRTSYELVSNGFPETTFDDKKLHIVRNI